MKRPYLLLLALAACTQGSTPPPSLTRSYSYSDTGIIECKYGYPPSPAVREYFDAKVPTTTVTSQGMGDADVNFVSMRFMSTYETLPIRFWGGQPNPNVNCRELSEAETEPKNLHALLQLPKITHIPAQTIYVEIVP